MTPEEAAERTLKRVPRLVEVLAVLALVFAFIESNLLYREVTFAIAFILIVLSAALEGIVEGVLMLHRSR